MCKRDGAGYYDGCQTRRLDGEGKARAGKWWIQISDFRSVRVSRLCPKSRFLLKREDSA